MPSIKINNEELIFNNIYYVDSINGSDQNSGSEESPFLTVNYAVSKCATSGDAIYAKSGTHDVTRIAGTYDSGGLWDDSKAIAFIGARGETIFVCDGNKHSGRDTHCIMFRNTGTKAYQITFDFRAGNRTGNYYTSICGAGGPVTRGEIINCLFKIDSPSPSFSYSNDGTSITKFTNCVFDVKGNFVGSYSGGAGITLENCITNFTFYAEGIKTNIYDKGSFDPKYHITNFDEIILNAGIYSGKYGWTIDKILFQSNNKIYSIESVDTWHNFKMISDNAPTPLKASASSNYSSSYPAWYAFNGITSYPWVTANGIKTGWIQLDFGKKTKVSKLKIGANGDTGDVRTFKVLGSNDGNTFKELRYFKGSYTWNKDQYTEFDLGKYFEYKIFRVEIITNAGRSNYSVIGDIVLGWTGSAYKEVPNSSMLNFKTYGVNQLARLDSVTHSKDYILQSKTSENKEGLWVVTLNKKPLAIEFGNK